MSRMLLAEERMLALKTATRLLIARLGTFEAAASACRLSVSALQECTSRDPRHRDRLLPLDVALQLEEVAGEPLVTAALARLQGFTVVRPEASSPVEIGRSVAALSRHAGEAGARFMEANADGVLDAAEKAELQRQFEAVRDSVEAALAQLGKTALRVVA